ncbi:MAG: class I SAM-dependent methyltransferase [Patescibacteria group bacterium]
MLKFYQEKSEQYKIAKDNKGEESLISNSPHRDREFQNQGAGYWQKEVCEYIKENYLNNFKKPKILDLGCGRGTFSVKEFFSKLSDSSIAGVDYFVENLKYYKEAKSRIVANAIKLPFKNASFDIVITSNLTSDNKYFDKQDNLNKLASEIGRIVKKGGIIVLMYEDLELSEYLKEEQFQFLEDVATYFILKKF